MIVCLCHGINDKKLKELIEDQSVRKLGDLKRLCGAGGDCGMCILEIKRMLSKTPAAASSEDDMVARS